jgi:hypothetical protein
VDVGAFVCGCVDFVCVDVGVCVWRAEFVDFETQ